MYLCIFVSIVCVYIYIVIFIVCVYIYIVCVYIYISYVYLNIYILYISIVYIYIYIRRPLPTAGGARQRRDYKQQVLCSASEGQARGGQKGKPGAE